MFKKIIPCLFLSSFISSPSLQAGACFADISEFKTLKAFHTPQSASLESYYAESPRSIGSYPANAKWFLKRSQSNWIFNEFIASALYQEVLGKDLVGSAYLVCDKNDDSKFWLATEFLSQLVPFEAQEGDAEFSDGYANGISFSCLLGGCWFTDASHIHGLEKAVLTSLLFFEHDIPRGHNFGVVNGTTVTRFDFDDSFKFLDIYGISPGLTAKGLSNEFKSFLSKNGIDLKGFLKATNDESPRRPSKFLKEDMKDFFPNLKADFNSAKLLKAGLDILKVSPETLHQIIDRKLKTLSEVVEPGLWKAYYKIPREYKMHSTFDYATKTCGAAFDEIDREGASPTFPGVFRGIKKAIDQLRSQSVVTTQHGVVDSNNRRFNTDCDVVLFSFNKEPIHKKLATIIKAYITYHYAALYVTCKQWQSTIAKTDL